MRNCCARAWSRWRVHRQLISHPNRWLVVRALAFALGAPVLMRLSFPRVNRFIERRRVAAMNRSPGAPSVNEIISCVDAALAVGRPLVRAGCLTRGLTRYYFLRQAGVEVRLCFGARLRHGELTTEAGHCWLETGGLPFLERSDPYRYSFPLCSLPLSGPKPPAPG